MSKLKLNKKTVSILDKDQLNAVKGGGAQAPAFTKLSIWRNDCGRRTRRTCCLTC
ncbi:class I lanthipeptide [Tenacibaculum finnmarkense]|uniref:class I lanthipeptide n=1 Tax=Tenacibaculum finnmarkense TaxID=2781243 RepID=UPI001EFC1BBE|nr:class I lanthipeptide [Tenacibaculum finnmarkense]MCD8411505.1 class I lanthipeptide [Tenacibaculum finnmarkense genomovar ulcerans]MCG8208273.1 class I lanthipeptide [Tenacibaculum finnmarkense genomovar finnmarkense]MCM8907407.1 class I lanthipeptide [Tenacibaculum finnmarkense genomovar finnmarkense]